MIPQPANRSFHLGAAVLQEDGVARQVVVVAEHEVLPEADAAAIAFFVERLGRQHAFAPDAQHIHVAVFRQIEQLPGTFRLPYVGGAFQRHPVAAAQKNGLAIDVEAKPSSRPWRDPSGPA